MHVEIDWLTLKSSPSHENLNVLRQRRSQDTQSLQPRDGGNGDGEAISPLTYAQTRESLQGLETWLMEHVEEVKGNTVTATIDYAGFDMVGVIVGADRGFDVTIESEREGKLEFEGAAFSNRRFRGEKGGIVVEEAIEAARKFGEGTKVPKWWKEGHSHEGVRVAYAIIGEVEGLVYGDLVKFLEGVRVWESGQGEGGECVSLYGDLELDERMVGYFSLEPEPHAFTPGKEGVENVVV